MVANLIFLGLRLDTETPGQPQLDKRDRRVTCILLNRLAISHSLRKKRGLRCEYLEEGFSET
ncbi:hypothetical protein LBWT_X3740 (plasmid) [Leptolyngbya boryana IAM M-101]|nr:hypothetical protein LBWT_X3740 [Leptolyngbya boryana IAM M-101]BAS66650.1 hypothetical protein LBDG_X3740 [Leptolyngbya boryana dg5]